MHSIHFSIWCVSPGCIISSSRELSIISKQWKLTPCFLMIFPKGNMQSVKSDGPSTEPWGTPYCTYDRCDTSSFTATNWWQSDKYDLNHTNALPLMPTKFSSLFWRMLWWIVSNVVLRSSSTNREIQPWSDDKSRSFVISLSTMRWSKSWLEILTDIIFL